MTTPHSPTTLSTHDCAHLQAVAALLDTGDTDAALAAGLMEMAALPSSTYCARACAAIIAAQARFSTAWAARARYLAREQRLQRRAAERQAQRQPPPTAATPQALPAAATAALARAKAKAAAKGQGR